MGFYTCLLFLKMESGFLSSVLAARLPGAGRAMARVGVTPGFLAPCPTLVRTH